ncbi:MAG TPA: NYN domain-containing protein [Candidatus Caccomorpha excrementavium]|nr:NYN domain-containing protein [Candidatus Caccomorpha excrementavium]
MAREFLLVDGYNIIFAWPKLKNLSEDSLESARVRLADILCNYQGFRKNEIILVFDGYKSKGNPGSVIHYHNIDIVYTKEAQTADQFIELVSSQLARDYQIRVATSDGLEQMIILAQGAVRMSAQELRSEIKRAEAEIRETYQRSARANTRNSLIDNLPPEMAELLERMRLKEDD